MDVIGCEIQLTQLFITSLFYLSDPKQKKTSLGIRATTEYKTQIYKNFKSEVIYL